MQCRSSNCHSIQCLVKLTLCEIKKKVKRRATCECCIRKVQAIRTDNWSPGCDALKHHVCRPVICRIQLIVLHTAPNLFIGKKVFVVTLTLGKCLVRCLAQFENILFSLEADALPLLCLYFFSMDAHSLVCNLNRRHSSNEGTNA